MRVLFCKINKNTEGVVPRFIKNKVVEVFNLDDLQCYFKRKLSKNTEGVLFTA